MFICLHRTRSSLPPPLHHSNTLLPQGTRLPVLTSPAAVRSDKIGVKVVWLLAE